MLRLRQADRVVHPDGGSGELLDRFRSSLDPEWIDEALEATGTATVRRRRLPAPDDPVVQRMLESLRRPIGEVIAGAAEVAAQAGMFLVITEDYWHVKDGMQHWADLLAAVLSSSEPRS